MPDAGARDRLKRMAAEAALEYVEPGAVVGVGTGSTTNFFIDLLAGIQDRFRAAVASSETTARRLAAHGIRVLDFAEMDALPIYVDGADEADGQLRLIKGGGGALTREKVLAGAARRFVCIVDASKRVEVLGTYPLPVEVIPMAVGFVSRRLRESGGRPDLREDFTTDNGNAILDVHGLRIDDPPALERRLNQFPGVVTNGLFALRPADVLLVGTRDGVRTLTRD